jgi:hypothetical protein
MQIPQKLKRKAIILTFTRLSPETWRYLFEHEKENGLSECRTTGWGVRAAWYSSDALKLWLIARGDYTARDYEPPAQSEQRATPWSVLNRLPA